MKAVILAGGRGTRKSEESHLRPKPMVEIGGRPMLWHIMKIYAHHGITDFVICLGYKGYVEKEYVAKFFLHASDIPVDLARNDIVFHEARAEPWRVTLVDTGETTNTAGRILRVRQYLDADQPFCMTYGDGVADIDVRAEVSFHKDRGRQATMTVVRPPARFGSANLAGDAVVSFEEKPPREGGVVNGGFFVVNPSVLDKIEGDHDSWENSVLKQLVAQEQLGAWRHNGFWQSMDTLRDRELLESLWATEQAPWKVWG